MPRNRSACIAGLSSTYYLNHGQGISNKLRCCFSPPTLAVAKSQRSSHLSRRLPTHSPASWMSRMRSSTRRFDTLIQGRWSPSEIHDYYESLFDISASTIKIDFV